MIIKIKNLTEHLIQDNDTVNVALKKINKLGKKSNIFSNRKFLIVVNKCNQLIGTITDGDIRRGILAGLSYTSVVTKVANLKPVFGFIGEEVKNTAIMNELKAIEKFLPVLDNKKNVHEVIIPEERNIHKIKAVLMAGGFGKRMGEKTKTIPKPLLKHKGKELISYNFEIIFRSKYIDQVFVTTHYLSNLIEKHVKNIKSDKHIETIKEKEPLGTAGSLYKFRKEEAVLVMNTDIITNLTLDQLVNYHTEVNNDITITGALYNYEIPFGVINYDAMGNFLKMDEKPSIKKYVAAGIYILSKNVLRLINKDQFMDMPKLINKAKNKNFKIGVFPLHETWEHVGKKEDLRFF